MPVVEGFEVLTGTYLGQDWDLFGATTDEAITNYAREYPEDIELSIAGFERLIASSMTEDELLRHWSLELYGGYDPRHDGMTFREWFAHALEILRAESAERHV